MTKSDLIDRLSKKENLTEKSATNVINLIFEGFAKALEKGDKIEIRGFASFVVREYDAYTGRNPNTGEKVGYCKAETAALLQGGERIEGDG